MNKNANDNNNVNDNCEKLLIRYERALAVAQSITLAVLVSWAVLLLLSLFWLAERS